LLTFDLENKVKNILYRQIATETITIEQAEILKVRLGNLAFNLFSANHKKVLGLNLAISWLFDPRTEVLDKVIYEKESLTVIDDLPLRFTPQEQILATWLLTTAVQMGFLIEENDGFYFPDDNLQDYQITNILCPALIKTN
jgi:hypothetical protein